MFLPLFRKTFLWGPPCPLPRSLSFPSLQTRNYKLSLMDHTLLVLLSIADSLEASEVSLS